MFKKIITAITGFFSKEIPVVEAAYDNAVKIVNVLKTLAGSATGQTIEAIIEAVAPGFSTPIIAALNVLFIDFGLVVTELNKAPADIAADGLNAIGKLTGDSKTLALSNVSAIIGNTAGGSDSTLQKAIVATPIVYNHSVLGDAVVAAPVADAVQTGTAGVGVSDTQSNQGSPIIAT